MNKLIIIGNLTKDPVTRTTQSGLDVCSFTVAVNKRRSGQDGQQPEADFFNVSVWRDQALNCQKYLAKGRKVMVCGSVSLRQYTTQDGRSGANMEIQANEVEFLTPRDTMAFQDTMPQAAAAPAPAPVVDPQSGMQQVEEDELPF